MRLCLLRPGGHLLSDILGRMPARGQPGQAFAGRPLLLTSVCHSLMSPHQEGEKMGMKRGKDGMQSWGGGRCRGGWSPVGPSLLQP